MIEPDEREPNTPINKVITNNRINPVPAPSRVDNELVTFLTTATLPSNVLVITFVVLVVLFLISFASYILFLCFVIEKYRICFE